MVDKFSSFSFILYKNILFYNVCVIPMITSNNVNFVQQYQTKAEYAAEQIHNAILSGLFPAGSRLLIDEISKKFNISAIPVREALQRLEALSLIEIHSYRGFFVKELTLDEFEECLETRMLLECFAIEKAAKTFTSDDVEFVQNLLDRFLLLLKNNLTLEAREVHKELHFSLYRPAKSQLLLKAIELLWLNSERYRFFAGKFQKIDEAKLEHQRIIDACSKQNPKSASKALTNHMKKAAKRIRYNLKKYCN